MNNPIIIILAIVGPAIALAKFIEAWIGENGKQKLKEKLEDYWVVIEESEPTKITKIPLIILQAFYNTILGEKIFSKTAYFRSSAISAIVLISVLAISGLYTGVPFSIEKPPWVFWKTFSEENLIDTLKNKKDSLKSKEEIESNTEDKGDMERIDRLIKRLSFYSQKEWIVIHSILFIIMTLLLNAFFDATSLSITRLMLREAINSESKILYWCILLTNLMIAILLSTLAMIVVIFLYFPTTGLIIPVVIKLLMESPAWTTIGIFALIVAIWNLSGLWVKIIGFTTVLPILCLCFSLIIYSLVYPFRYKIKSFLSKLIIKTIDYEKGVLAFCIVILGLLGSFAGAIGLLLK